MSLALLNEKRDLVHLIKNENDILRNSLNVNSIGNEEF